jgi:S-adenosylmethionine:tRNA-ribosyltransferase-isomerase (queuine synthetase)
MKMDAFDYELPDARIAYTPAANRSDSKLLVWDKTILAEAQYKDIAQYIPSDHCLTTVKSLQLEYYLIKQFRHLLRKMILSNQNKLAKEIIK